jgi:hypothetical protein
LAGEPVRRLGRLDDVKTVVLGPRPAELEMLIRRRQALGLDAFDEVWEGMYHVAPAAHPAHGYVDHALAVLLDPYARAAGLVATGPFNLGTPDDYRVPDHGYHQCFPDVVWVPSAVVVVEIVSPDDETYAKFGFYAAHGVEEIIVADPQTCSVQCFQRQDDRYVEAPGSDALSVSAHDLTHGIDWPPRH